MKNIIKHNEKIEKYHFGGKANSLLKLVNNDITVPKFFILTSNAYQEFLNFNNIDIYTSNDEMKKKIECADFPSNLIEEVNRVWDQYQFIKVAVRSSATNEDGKEKSFAGQYESFLNVEKDDLMHAIKNCWKSLYEDNVVSYNDNGYSVSMNIIIQDMIAAEYAGVAFSLDPTMNSKNYSVIEAVEGLGEQLVSGSVTPSYFMVRRQTSRCDSSLGNVKLSDQWIAKLESCVLNIEKIFGVPVDIEWCIAKKHIYIVQTRPITAFNFHKIPYKKVISREKSLIEIEIYYQGEYEGIKSLTRDLYYFKPLFIYDREKDIVNIYYNDTNLEEEPSNIYYYMDLDLDKIKRMYEKVLDSCKYLNQVVDTDKNFKYKVFIENMLIIYPFTSLGNLAGRFENISPEIKSLLIDFRNHYDYILYKADEYLLMKAKNHLPEEYKEDLKYLLIHEIFDNQLPCKNIVEERKKGYIYFNGQFEWMEEYNEWLEKNNITIEMEQGQTVVKGNVAYSGVAKGKVCQVFKKEDFEKFKEGDILVTTMTTPKFTPILKSAAAIVTDEGGITCHAAIIARELKVPCIVGCKNATSMLRDGMFVEVNADSGIVNIMDGNY